MLTNTCKKNRSLIIKLHFQACLFGIQGLQSQKVTKFSGKHTSLPQLVGEKTKVFLQRLPKFYSILSIIAFLLSANFQSQGQNTIKLHSPVQKIFEAETQLHDNYTVQFGISDIDLNDFNYNNMHFAVVKIAGFGKSYQPGSPDLPAFVKVISVPLNVSLSAKIINYESEPINLSDYGIEAKIIPAVKSISKNENNEKVDYQMGSAYTINDYIGNEVVEFHEIGVMRNLRLYELVYHPVAYNPVQNKIKIRNNVSVQISWPDNLVDLADWDFEGSHEKPITKTPGSKHQDVNETYVIVSPIKYKATLQPFIKWKKQKGYQVIESYIGEQIAFTDKNIIKSYLKNLYVNPAEGFQAPSYLLIVGDVVDIPAWNGTTGSHVTDLYYAEYTGDFLPELYYGRFSVTDTLQLHTIINKTFFVEKGLGADYNFQNNHLLISGVDADYAPIYGNGALNYFLKYYSLADFGITPHYYLYGSGSPITSNNSQARQAILNDFSSGTSIAYYTAHCNAYGWSNPKFETADIAGLSNKDKYPLMIGNCCESLKFNLTSFGEEIVRVKDKGAVAYIGATDFSYWDEDYFWGIGFTSNIISSPEYTETGLGSFDAWFHTHSEAEETRAYTIGQILNTGNMAVQSSTSDFKNYYWEIYQIMGDPSLVPAKFQNEKIQATYNSVALLGQNSFALSTVAHAIVTLNEGSNILATGQADANGICNLIFSPLQNIGANQIELVVSLPDYMPLIDSLNVIAPNGAYLVFEGKNLTDTLGNNNGVVDYGETLALKFLIRNFGTEKANTVHALLSTTSPWVLNTIVDTDVPIGDIAPGELKISEGDLIIELANNIPNSETIIFTGRLQYVNGEAQEFEFRLTVNSPKIESANFIVDATGIGNHDGIIQSNESVSINLQFTNTGFSQVSNTILSIYSPDETIFIPLSGPTDLGGFNTGESKYVEVQIQAGFDIFEGTQVEMTYKLTAGDKMQFVFEGSIPLVIGGEPGFNMSNGSAEVASAYFYDSGGAENNYTNNENSTLTFYPHDTKSGLLIDILEFDVEPSSTGCYDKLYVYDGINTEAPPIGVFCNNNVKYTLQSQNTAGALTFKFTSDAGVTRPGWVAYLSSAKKYPVTFLVTDGVDMLDSALVVLANATDTTKSGLIVFENVLAKTKKDYSISKEGYFEFKGSLGEINSDTTLTILLQSLPDICITIADGIEPIEGATVKFDNRTLITDANGFANFINVTPGSKTFIATMPGYKDTSGIIDVNTIDVCYFIKLTKLPTYKASFVITDEFGPLVQAKISLNNVNQLSDNSGHAVFNELSNGNYDFSISRTGYIANSGSITIADSDLTIPLQLNHITYSAKFNVSHNGFSVAGALVSINNKSALTSTLGIAEINNIIPDEAIPFVISKEGYTEYAGIFDMYNDDVELNIDLFPLGIRESGLNQLEIYPNPLSKNVELNIKSNKNITELHIFNYSGVLLVNKKYHNKEIILELSDFSAGIYIFQIRIDDLWFFEKVIIE